MSYATSVVSQVVLVVKNLPANAGNLRDMDLIPGSGNPLEKEMAAHSRILVWRIPWTEEPGGLQSTESQRVGHDRSDFTSHRRNVNKIIGPAWRMFVG